MRSLCVLCVLLSVVQGVVEMKHVEVYTIQNQTVLLDAPECKVSDSDTVNWQKGKAALARWKKGKGETYYSSCMNTCILHQNGSLLLPKIKEHTEPYIMTVYSSDGKLKCNRNLTVIVQAPVSKPVLNVSCLLDGGADIVCMTDAGDDPQFSIMVNRYFLLENSTSSRTVEYANEVNVTAALPGPWDITCSVRNQVSESETSKTEVICPVPPSDLVLEDSCLHDGSRQVSCFAENGTDLFFSLSVNKTLLVEKATKEQERVNVTLSSPGPWDFQCSARNNVNDKNKTKTYLACPVPPSDPVLWISCYNSSLQVSCSVEKGTDPIFFLSVNEKTLLENITSEQKRVNSTLSSPGPWAVHCSVRNHLGEKNKSDTFLTCPVPLSAPIINASCQNDGTARVVCEVESASNATYTWSVNGKPFHLSHTPNLTINASEFASGPINVSCSAENSVNKENSSNNEIFCDVPLSAPIINASCQNDGTARVVCEVESASNATYTWSVNGKPFHLSHTPNLTINASEFASGPINVSCSAENSVNKENSSNNEIFCDAPVSDPVLNASCFSNGSAAITCWILGGTNPKFHLTVNGDVIPFPNTCTSCSWFNYTISARGPWNISCSVENKIRKSMSNIPSLSCPVHSESSCLSCLQKSLIGGAVALIVTTSPLLIAYFYIGRNAKEE